MDRCGLCSDRNQGPRIPAAPIRGVLSVPPGDALRLPAQVAVSAAVPADAWHAGDAGAVDFTCSTGCVQEGAYRTTDHAWLSAAERAGVPKRGLGSTR